jgi:acyl-CoA synthetase (AMP-forming)/AMP-acid ligase II
MLGIVKAGAILVNVNYRYVEGELRYLFDNSDMVALVHERQYADRVANVLPEVPNVKTVVVVEDAAGSVVVEPGSPCAATRGATTTRAVASRRVRRRSFMPQRRRCFSAGR